MERGMVLITLQWIAAVFMAAQAWAIARIVDGENGVADQGRGDGYSMARHWGR